MVVTLTLIYNTYKLAYKTFNLLSNVVNSIQTRSFGAHYTTIVFIYSTRVAGHSLFLNTVLH